ncbi:unnamed protein product [Nezara viridula]|uniref:Uncharacterized protein n=1 Tax=Nezara viridula TaxID=85310 RepID=A0A9P0EBA1_NEZVI|nr:unnamed protein product [Nezara viridula]
MWIPPLLFASPIRFSGCHHEKVWGRFPHPSPSPALLLPYLLTLPPTIYFIYRGSWWGSWVNTAKSKASSWLAFPSHSSGSYWPALLGIVLLSSTFERAASVQTI